MPALILAFFAHDHNRRADDGGIGEPKLDRLRREKFPSQPGIQSQGGRGGTGRARMEQPFAIANGGIRYRLRDRNGKTLKPVA
ncbi:hypothetical protein X759_33440 [Mesorhizobium sp. LSHC420B00]|nr:hypothetical protein X759_33440 [Mesorhizobium sp. LSHC420B00]